MMPAEGLTLPGTNTVLTPFPFRFEFPITEGAEFFTNIIEAADGTEQRIAIRDPARPRQHVAAHVIAFDRNELAHLKALLFGWNLQRYGVPLWFHAMRLATDAMAGDLTLTVDDCDGRDLTERLDLEDDVPVLLWRAHDDWEPGILSAAADGTLTLRDPIARDWPAGEATVLPLALMLLAADPIQLEASAPAIAELDLEFVSSITPLSTNASCAGDAAPSTPDPGDNPEARALMVRPSGTMRLDAVTGSAFDHEQHNCGSLHPQYWEDRILWGYTASVWIKSVATPGTSMYSTSRGRLTGFSKCTSKCPGEHTLPIVGLGICSTDSLTPVPGTDYLLSVMGSDYPAGIDGTFEDGLPVEVTFSGTHFFPTVGNPPVTRHWVISKVTLKGGYCRALVKTIGSEVTGYMLASGGGSFTLKAESNMPGDSVNFEHGFCIRLANIADYKGVKVVTEEVLYDGDGHETGTFGTPDPHTHNFTSDDYIAADVGSPPPGFFFSVHAGGTDVFGAMHDLGTANGYSHSTDRELYRVTVSLIRPDDTEEEQWKDIFPTQLAFAVMGS
jgi:hypothetical protein